MVIYYKTASTETAMDGYTCLDNSTPLPPVRYLKRVDDYNDGPSTQTDLSTDSCGQCLYPQYKCISSQGDKSITETQYSFRVNDDGDIITTIKTTVDYQPAEKTCQALGKAPCVGELIPRAFDCGYYYGSNSCPRANFIEQETCSSLPILNCRTNHTGYSSYDCTLVVDTPCPPTGPSSINFFYNETGNGGTKIDISQEKKISYFQDLAQQSVDKKIIKQSFFKWGVIGFNLRVDPPKLDPNSTTTIKQRLKFKVGAYKDDLKKYKNISGKVYLYAGGAEDAPVPCDCGANGAYSGTILQTSSYTLSPGGEEVDGLELSSSEIEFSNVSVPNNLDSAELGACFTVDSLEFL
jgi:hypothetical protein